MPIAYNPDTGEALLMGADGKMAPTPTAKNSLGDVMALGHDGKMQMVYRSPKNEEAAKSLEAAAPFMAMGGMTPEMMQGQTLKNSVFGGMVRGGRDVVDAGAQLLTRGLEAGANAVAPNSSAADFLKGQREKVEGINQNAAKDYEENWRGVNRGTPDLGRLIGQTAMTAPIAAAMPGALAPSLLARTAGGAATGGTVGALQPVDTSQTPDFWKEKAKQAGLGAAVGGGVPAVVGGAAQLVSPQMRADLAQLVASGGKPTIGQILGGVANKIEEGATKIPLVGDVIRNARQRSQDAFQAAQEKALQGWRTKTIDEALAPIGEKLTTGVTGREAVDEMSTKVGAAYDKLLPKMKVTADPQFNNDFLGTLSGAKPGLSEDGQRRLTGLLDKEVFSKFDKGATMTGETFKTVEGALKDKIATFRRSTSADDSFIGDALQDTLGHLKALQMRSNPTLAVDLQKTNAAFARSKVVQRAASSVEGEGEFTPREMLQAVKTSDRQRGNFASGKAMMQPGAQAGRDMMQAGKQAGESLGGVGEKPNDLYGIPLEAGLLTAAHMAGHPVAAVGTGLAGVGAGLLYSPWGQGAARALMIGRQSPAWQAAAQQLRSLTPQLSGVGGNMAGKILPGLW